MGHFFQNAYKVDDSVAQLVEHIPFKDGVLGSNPSWITKLKPFNSIWEAFFVVRNEEGEMRNEARNKTATIISLFLPTIDSVTKGIV